jgi:hypothetical protein
MSSSEYSLQEEKMSHLEEKCLRCPVLISNCSTVFVMNGVWIED